MRKYQCLKNQEFEIGEFSIRTIQDTDIENIRIWRNAQIDILRQKGTIAKEDQIQYFENHIWPTMTIPNPANILFSFFKKEEHIGYGGLVHLSWEDKRSEMSFLLNPIFTKEEAVYESYFSAYIDLIKLVNFDDLKFHKVFVETYAIRKFHISVLEKNGFEFEGAMRDHVFIDGAYTDSLLHSILKKENV